MIWKILGIEATKDKKQITSAYRQKLRGTNPEDKPEEFKALRDAYEQALAYAEQADLPQAQDQDLSPLDRFMAQVEAVYWFFPSRLNVDKWRELLDQDICEGLDTRREAEQALISFFMEHYWLPQTVWQELDREFRFEERKEELLETYPPAFVENVILQGIRMGTSLDLSLFTPGKNGRECDEYIHIYHQSMQHSPKDALPIMERICLLSESHPHGSLALYQLYLHNGQEEKGKAGIGELYRQYPTDAPILTEWAQILFTEGKWEEAEALVRSLPEEKADFVPARKLLAKCYAQKGQYMEAKEIAYDLMHVLSGNPFEMQDCVESIKEWNMELKKELSLRLREDPKDSVALIELAWCHIQEDDYDGALRHFRAIDAESADPVEYHNLGGKLLFHKEEIESALKHFELLNKAIEDLPAQEAKTEKNVRRYAKSVELQGICLHSLGQREKAHCKFRQALEITPDRVDVLGSLAWALLRDGDVEAAVDYARQLLDTDPYAFSGHDILCEGLYLLHRDQEAYQAAENALLKAGRTVHFYYIQMATLIRSGMSGDVGEILDYLKEEGAPQDISLDYIAARLKEEEDPKAALKTYMDLSKRLEAGEGFLYQWEIHYRIATLLREDDPRSALDYLDKGLRDAPTNCDCLRLKAIILSEGKKREEAIELLENARQKNSDPTLHLYTLAHLYSQNMRRYAKETFASFEALSKKHMTPEYAFYMAGAKRHMGQREEAEYYYRKELELDPQDVDGYYGLCLLYTADKRYEEALSFIDTAITYMEEAGEQYDWLMEQRVQILRRMGKAEEALDYVVHMQRKYRYRDGFQLRFDICLQFALWKRAKDVLAQWQLAHPADVARVNAASKLYLLQGKYFKASTAMGLVKPKLDRDEADEFRCQLQALEGKWDKLCRFYAGKVKEQPKDGYLSVNYAMYLWFAGLRNEARTEAQRGLDIHDKALCLDRPDEAMWRSRRALLLAILGREQEARQELERTRQLPLCIHCDYCACKDADIYEECMEEIFGNYDTAAELTRRGKELWPDDLDYHTAEARLKKGGHKC